MIVHDLEPTLASFADAVADGLAQPQKSVPCKFFYDEAGAQLFDQICTLPEYYPTRTEIGILQECAGELAELVGPNAQLVEFGSGLSPKVRILLDAFRDCAVYVPVDISREALVATAADVGADYPGLHVEAVCADYTAPFDVPAHTTGRRVVFFPGSTVGNFHPEAAQQFLARTARMLGPGGLLVIGVDLRKDASVLEAAYDDVAGVTAAFNLNLLVRMNRELGADFDLTTFAHRAIWNDVDSRIEMHLESLVDQDVTVDGRLVHFDAGETIYTEDSYKYSPDGFAALAEAAGFVREQVWTDPDDLFSVQLYRV